MSYWAEAFLAADTWAAELLTLILTGLREEITFIKILVK